MNEKQGNEGDRKKITKKLKTNGLQFHSFKPMEERAKKVVLKGAPNMDQEEIKKELEEKGVKVQKCTKLKGKGDISFSYLISISKEKNIGSIKNQQHQVCESEMGHFYQDPQIYSMLQRL